VAEIKYKEPNPDSESDSKTTSKGQIIDADPTAIVATATIQPKELTKACRKGCSKEKIFLLHTFLSCSSTC
jgi:hypothetical protein